MKRILIIGLGSIGLRHLQAINALGTFELASLRTGKGQKVIDESLMRKITIFSNETEALSWAPTHIIISNPTSLHLNYVKLALKNNIPFFVEKPIADNLGEINDDQILQNTKGVVGYNLRFHSLFQFLYNHIQNNTFGSLITANLHVGQYLPNWHPYEDYTQAYYAQKKMGGGAIRTLSHEIDLVQHLFGNITSIQAQVEKLSELEIDVDDVVNISVKTRNCKRVTLHINYLDPIVQRFGLIYFTKGLVKYNYISSEISYIPNNGNNIETFTFKEDSKVQYENQMKEFLFQEKPTIACNFQQGINVMKYIEVCEQSNNEKKEICLI